MSKYDESYCEEHDIDYFYIKDGVLELHASNGHLIPENISREDNRQYQIEVYNKIAAAREDPNEYKHKLDQAENEFDMDAVLEALKDANGQRKITRYDISNYVAGFIEYSMVGCECYDTLKDGSAIHIARAVRDSSTGSGNGSGNDSGSGSGLRPTVYEINADLFKSTKREKEDESAYYYIEATG